MSKKRLSLSEQYEKLCETPSDIYEHLPTFVLLVESQNAEHVLELGTRSGVSTVAWLYGLELTDGRLTSVDLEPAPKIGPYDRWTFVQGNDLNPDLICGLDRADIVFIDTTHFYEQTVSELNLYRWLVKVGGIMVLHDTELIRPEYAPASPTYPVKKAVKEFCDANGYDVTFHKNCNGLGIIEGF